MLDDAHRFRGAWLQAGSSSFDVDIAIAPLIAGCQTARGMAAKALLIWRASTGQRMLSATPVIILGDGDGDGDGTSPPRRRTSLC